MASMSVSRIVPIIAEGASRRARWMCTTPRNRPVGVSRGGLQTNMMAAKAGGMSARRAEARAVAIVASGGRTIGSVVMRPPAVRSS